MTTKRIRLLCVGLGGMGRNDWSNAANVPDFELVAGVDVGEEPRKAFEQETGCATYDDFDEALGAVKADATLIATPDAFHTPFTIKALEAGLDVICEKPMAETLEDARRMHETADKHGRMLMIHHQLRWWPVYQRMRQAVCGGEIGSLRSVTLEMFVQSSACIRGYRSKLKHLILRDLSIHHFDLMRHVTGQEVKSIYVRSWPSNEEQVEISAATDVYAILSMTGPVEAAYRSRMRSLSEKTDYSCWIELNGSKGSIWFRGGDLLHQTHQGHADDAEPRVLDLLPSDKCAPWQSFADAMKNRIPTFTSSADNLKSLEVLFAAIESAETGQIVQTS